MQASTVRFEYKIVAPGVYEAMDSLDGYIARCGLEVSVVLLVQLYASQINGCAYCIDMHWKQLELAGEEHLRMYSLSVWPECAYYTERERAALLWTETITLVTKDHASDETYQHVSLHFSQRELADLTLAIVAINGWNRLCIAARLEPGRFDITAQT